jgi:hypothetical protein
MECCSPSSNTREGDANCPLCGGKGKKVQLITLKSLLKASALENIEPDASYYFCPSSSCPTVYFSGSQTFTENNVKLPVYQKNQNMKVPVCYCFDWTRERLIKAADTDQPVDQIKAHVQAGRCGCEVNNPQGACCLGNVTTFLHSLNKK